MSKASYKILLSIILKDCIFVLNVNCNVNKGVLVLMILILVSTIDFKTKSMLTDILAAILHAGPKNFLVIAKNIKTFVLNVLIIRVFHLVDWTGWISHVHLVDWTRKNEFLLIKDHMAKDQGGLFSTPRNFLAYMV